MNLQIVEPKSLPPHIDGIITEAIYRDCRDTDSSKMSLVSTHKSDRGTEIYFAYTRNSFDEMYRGGDYLFTIDPKTGNAYCSLFD